MKQLVCIVEDSVPFQQALKRIVEDSDEFLLGTVFSSAEAALQLEKAPPDLVVVDIQLPGMSGIELIKYLKPRTPTTVYLVCSMHDDDEHIITALESGATGYILKDSSSAKIREALVEISKGGAPMSPYVARRIISFFQKPKIAEAAALLSERELEVIQLLAKGLQYKEIAAKLCLATETVKTHIRNVYHKLHVQNKVEALNKLRLM